MRLHFRLSANTQPVPFDYLHFLTGAFHKWIGPNPMHDALSLYSLSWLRGGRAQDGALSFPGGATWFIGAHDASLLETLSDAILKSPDVCCGMQIETIKVQQTPHFGGYQAFTAASPILARSKEIEGKVKHFKFSDPEADAVLTQTLRHKMDQAGLEARHKTATVRFDRAHPKAKTKLLRIKNISNVASLCPVIIEGTPEAVQFAWNVGVGHLTGSGFGSLL